MSQEPRILEKRLYTATATATGGRDGTVRTDDGALDLTIVPPKALGGRDVPGTNPEQLFAAGYSACFGSALAVVAAFSSVSWASVIQALPTTSAPFAQICDDATIASQLSFWSFVISS